MRYTPFETMDRPCEDLRREMWAARNDPGVARGDWGAVSGRDDPAVDLTEHGSEYVLTVDLPGFEREDLPVEGEFEEHARRIDID